VSDPWEAFVQRAATAETAGYFERARGHSTPDGLSVWFDRGHALPPVTRRTGLDDLARATIRHLKSDAKAVVLGYLGFDAVGLVEPTLAAYPSGSPFPLGEFVLAERSHIAVAPRAHRIAPVAARHRAPPPLSDTLSQAQFMTAVGHLRAAIREGEAFQVVLAHRRGWLRPPDLLARAGRLRQLERFAFFYYLKVGDREILGASPESVVEVDGTTARVNPIAGTIPRSASTTRARLLYDPKELAEHRMLVDLARNDLGRISGAGSVKVLSKERRVRYARLDHLVSRVAGRLLPGADAWSALRATFPAGTVSGAPKIRATEWIRREECTWRGPYGGTVGLLRPGGRADWALAIRGGFAAGRRLYTAAGAGIVYRSRPRREYAETLAKLAQVESTLAHGAE
jgi:anthranilate synthase component 1